MSLALALGSLTAGAALTHGLTRYRQRTSAPPSFPGLLQWAAFPAEGVVWLKDGAFMATWEFSGPDLRFATVEQVEALARQFNRVVCALGGRHMAHVDCCRVPSREYDSAPGFTSAVGHFLDEVSREQYEAGVALEDRYFLTITYLPPEDVYQKANQVFVSSTGTTGVDWGGEIEAFEAQLKSFEDLMPKPIPMRRLGTSDLASYLHYLLKGEFEPIDGPPDAQFADFLFDQDFRPGFEPVLGNHFHRVVSVQGYPRDAFMGILRELDDLAFPYRYSTRLIGVDPADANKLIKRRMERWFRKREGAKDVLSQAVSGGNAGLQPPAPALVNVFADDQAADAQDAFREAQTGLSRFVSHTACVIVRGESLAEVNERAGRVRKVFAHRGFVTVLETANATEALLGSYPGHGHYNVRRVPIRSDYVTRVMPLSRTYPGPAENPCKLYPDHSPVLFYARTSEHVPFRFCPFVGQVGHTIIVGPTGSGKSILMGYEGYRHQQYENARTVMFDNGNSFALLCEAMGGTRYEIGGDGVGFQPLRGIVDPEERRWAADWVASLVQLQGGEVTPTRRRHITETLDHMASRAQHNPEYLTMRELEVQLQDRALKDAIAPYAGSGALGDLLNASTDRMAEERFQVFELSSIIGLSPELVTPLLLYIFHRVGQQLDASRPTFVGADEFFLLAAKSEVGRAYCLEALRTYRKYNAYMTIATQDAGDLVPTGRGDDLAAVLNSCRTRIYLPNPDALEPVQFEAYLEHGLNEREIREVADAVPQRDYVVRQPDGTRRFHLGLGAELAFLTPLKGMTMVETAARLREVRAEAGPEWLHTWLRMRGVPEAEAARALEPRHLARAGAEVPGADAPEPGGDLAAAPPLEAAIAAADGEPLDYDGVPPLSHGDGASTTPATDTPLPSSR